MPVPVTPPQNLDLKLRFGAGLNSRGSADEIDAIECADGENYRLDRNNSEFRPRPPFDLAGTAPNAARINGFAQLRKVDGTITTLVQAGTLVYKWDGADDWVDTAVTVSSSARLRGDPKKSHWTLAPEKVLIADIARVEALMEWDGTTLGDVSTNLAGDFKCKYVLVDGERALYSNVESNSVVTPHMMVGSKVEDYTTLTTSNKPASALGKADAFFMLSPDLKPINGIERAFNVTFFSSELGSMFKITGEDSQNFLMDSLYAGSNASGDEAMVFVGNDVFYGRIGRIESMIATLNFGDIESGDPSVPIQNLIEDKAAWTALYNPITQLVHFFHSDLGEIWTYYKPLIARDERLSPWIRYTTLHPSNFQITAAMVLFNPSTGDDTTFFGDAIGRVYRLEGTGTGGDGGTTDIKAFRTSRLFAPRLDETQFEIEGWVTFLKREATSLTITAKWQGDLVFDRTFSIPIDAPTGGAFYGGDFHYGGEHFYGSSELDKFKRKRFDVGTGSNFIQWKTEVQSKADYKIQELLLRSRGTSD